MYKILLAPKNTINTAYHSDNFCYRQLVL